ncbi:hypothetical protein [Hymenobacter aerophilus]|uniref:hypothetical protein n=1 Tax=Hymenobacter aerophilus TaxID=119644 RepID=UPI0003676128|nr:hypothetical protein [Hymenobacter aerophilus]
MKARYIALLAGLLPLSAAAQQSAADQMGAAGQANLNSLVAGAPTVVPGGNSANTVGSPYLDKRWLPARLKMSNNLPLAPVPIKVDILNQRLLMRPLNKPTDSLQLNDQLVAGFELDEPATPLAPARTRIFRRFTESPNPRHQADYVEVLHKGRYTLLRRYIKQLNKADSHQAYGSSRNYDEILDSSQYFLLRPDKKLVPLKLTLKMLQAAAPELALKTVSGAETAKTDTDWAAVLATAEAR